MLEVWKPVVGYESHYQVSSLGRVRRVAGNQGARVGKVLKTHGRYPTVVLHRNGDGGKTFNVHVLVWTAFCGQRAAGMEINHKDLNKQNCRLSNLEVLTHQQNAQHAVAHGVKGGRWKKKV